MVGFLYSAVLLLVVEVSTLLFPLTTTERATEDAASPMTHFVTVVHTEEEGVLAPGAYPAHLYERLSAHYYNILCSSILLLTFIYICSTYPLFE